MSKGFGKPKIVPEPQQIYVAELKKTFATDGSEWLIGTATIRISKKLADPARVECKSRVWNCFAEAIAYHLLFSQEVCDRKVNTVFVLRPTKANPFPPPVARVSYIPWHEKHSSSGDPVECDDQTLNVIEAAAKVCQVELNWLDVPKAC